MPRIPYCGQPRHLRLGHDSMDIGVVLPQTELGTDPRVISGYVTRIHELGFHHLLASDHVVGADRNVHPSATPPYVVESTFHEPLALFGFISALADLGLATAVLILPQRQTALVAKQAAEVDLLCGGKLRLGVGVGWNAIEFDTLGMDFTNRGRRIEEQVRLMRLLWEEKSVTFTGRFDRVDGAGISPRPIQRPIPVWFGAKSPGALRRAGRLADGWFPQARPGPEFDAELSVVRAAAAEAGRDPDILGLEGRVQWCLGGLSHVLDELAAWAALGATHGSVDTMGCGFSSLDEHLSALEATASALRLAQRAAAS
jgi:probable F420-dependent oxidoreductase